MTTMPPAVRGDLRGPGAARPPGPRAGDRRPGRGHLPLARRGRLGEPAVVLPAVPRPADGPHHRPSRLDRREGPRRRPEVDLQLSENVAAGIPRASAVRILNDHDTGYPFACLEASIISATRTRRPPRWRPTASRRGGHVRAGQVRRVGLIARYIHAFLAGTGWTFDQIGVYDTRRRARPGSATTWNRPSGAPTRPGSPCDSAERLVRCSDLVIFATVAARPHVDDPAWFDHHPLVLHVSLRDLSRGPARRGQHRRRRRALPEGTLTAPFSNSSPATATSSTARSTTS